ncbi:MAG: alpha/beta hydrolase [Myxococcota bacterium]
MIDSKSTLTASSPSSRPALELIPVGDRPGTAVNLIVHGADSGEALFASAGKTDWPGATYFVRWPVLDIRSFFQDNATRMIQAGLQESLSLTAVGGSLKSSGWNAFRTAVNQARVAAPELLHALDRVERFHHGAPVNLVAHSMGTVLVTEALADSRLNSQVERAVLMTSPLPASPWPETLRDDPRVTNIRSQEDELLNMLERPTLGTTSLPEESGRARAPTDVLLEIDHGDHADFLHLYGAPHEMMNLTNDELMRRIEQDSPGWACRQNSLGTRAMRNIRHGAASAVGIRLSSSSNG